MMWLFAIAFVAWVRWFMRLMDDEQYLEAFMDGCRAARENAEEIRREAA